MSTQPHRSGDPLADPDRHPDAYFGAVLLSDQIRYYIEKYHPPLLQNPEGKPLDFDELDRSLDAASYKLRLGNEAHVGGKRVRISSRNPLVIPAHQVAVVKTHEVVNIPRFLIARWNLRVKWVYEGLLWVGGPQVDPGWRGELYCPIYNLAEREVVIPYKERFFTMDFARTTPFSEQPSSTGYRPKAHKPGRDKSLQSHDIHRLRSAPFESLKRLASLDTRVNSFNNFTFLVLAVMIAAIGVIATFGGIRSSQSSGGGDLGEATGNGLLVLTTVALVFGFSALLISVIAMVSKSDPVPRASPILAILGILGVAFMCGGAVLLTLTATSASPPWLDWLGVLSWSVSVVLILIGFGALAGLWYRATKP